MPMPPDFEDEMLVAYLDGELPSEQAAMITSGLRSNPELQQRVSALRATWELLGDLPGPKPRVDLAQSTIEIVTLALERESQSWWDWLLKRRWLMLGLAALVMMVAGGVTSKSLTRYMTGRILVDLPVLVDYRTLENIDSVEWLEQLAAIDNLIPAGAGGGPAIIGDGQVPREITARRKWVEGLNEVDRGRLGDNLEAFFKVPEERRERLRKIAVKIFEDETRTPHLLGSIRAYWALLERLGTRQATTLNSMEPIEDRLKQVTERVGNEMVLLYSSSVSREDQQAIRDWLDQLHYREELFSSLGFGADPDLRIISELLYGDAQNSFITQEDTDKLVREGLSDHARRLLADLSSNPSRRVALGLWVSSVVQPAENGSAKMVDAAGLAKKFGELEGSERDRLELMPEDAARNELRRQLGVPDLAPDNTSGVLDSNRRPAGNNATERPSLPLKERL